MNTKQRGTSTGAWIFLSVILIIGTVIVLTVIGSNAQKEEQMRIQSDERAQQRLQQITDDLNAEYYDTCIADANDSYTEQWNEKAKVYGYADNKLPQDEAEFLDKRLKDAKDECHRLYN